MNKLIVILFLSFGCKEIVTEVVVEERVDTLIVHNGVPHLEDFDFGWYEIQLQSAPPSGREVVSYHYAEYINGTISVDDILPYLWLAGQEMGGLDTIGTFVGIWAETLQFVDTSIGGRDFRYLRPKNPIDSLGGGFAFVNVPLTKKYNTIQFKYWYGRGEMGLSKGIIR